MLCLVSAAVDNCTQLLGGGGKKQLSNPVPFTVVVPIDGDVCMCTGVPSSK